MDRGAWWATVYRLSKRWTQLKWLSTHAHWEQVISPGDLGWSAGVLWKALWAHLCTEEAQGSNQTKPQGIREECFVAEVELAGVFLKDKKTMWFVHTHTHTHTAEYYSIIKKWNSVVCSNMDGPRDCHTEWRQRKKCCVTSLICGI